MPFERSLNTERALTLPRPSLRGISHLVAFIASIPAGGWLTFLAPPGTARTSVVVFAVCITAMFGISALLHRREWSPDAYEIMFRLDHTGILLAIAGTATPLAVLGVEGTASTVLVWLTWGLALIAAVLIWMPFPPPRGMTNTIFMTLSAIPLLFIPVMQIGTTGLVLLLGGAVIYAVGAGIVALQRPDPMPETFGYHEIFHLMVIAAVALHYTLVATVLIPLA